MDRLRDGAEFAGYRIEAEAGRGGMGIVYRAVHMKLGRLVALKLIAPDLAEAEPFRTRFAAEARTAASVDHPNVIPIYEADEAGGQLFLAMRYVEGTDLRTLIQTNGRLAPARATGIIDQVGAALDAAHARGLVHRDVKPGNILITGPEGREHVYLTDFGLAKPVTAGHGVTKTGQWVGTLDYVAPEQIEGRPLDARTDVYGLGCVLYQTVSGRVPFERDTELAKISAHLNDPPPALSTVADAPPELDAVVRRALAKRGQDRYPSAGDLGRAAIAASQRTPVLQPDEAGVPPTVSSERPVGDVPARSESPSGSKSPSRLRGALSAAAVAILIGAAAVVVLTDALSTQDHRPASSSERLDNRRFAAEVNQVCRDLAPRAEAANRRIDRSDPAAVRAGYDSARSVVAELHKRLRSLTPPPGLASDYRAYLGLFGDFRSLFARIASARLAGDTQRLRRLEPEVDSLNRQSRRYARKLGFDRACLGGGPAQP